MTFDAIRNLVLFQTNNDIIDLPDYQPAIEGYINEGYDILAYEYDNLHLDEVRSGETVAAYPTMEATNDEPNIPEWMHSAIADYATYMMYRNGNAIKQNRGIPYYQKFLEVKSKAAFANRNKKRKLKNLYVEAFY